MAVIDPNHLIDQALLLIKATLGRKPRQVDLRRAISASYYAVYYAVFHALLAAAADEFVGKTVRNDPRYALVYRSIDHGTARRLCDAVTQTKPIPKYEPFWPKQGFEPNLRRFVNGLVQLQIQRHQADYNPSAHFTSNDAGIAIKLAKDALDAFAQASRDGKVLLLTLLIFPPR